MNNEITDYFAMRLLMPETEYREVYQKNLLDNGRKVNTKKIAEYFHVDISLAAQRGNDLGLVVAW